MTDAKTKPKTRADADEWRMMREVEAAKVIRAQIADLMQGEEADKELIRDMVEGETSIRDLLSTMVINEAKDDELLAGIKARADELSKRKARIERRSDARRSLMLLAMQLAELDRHETPDGTISLRATPVSADIVEEADLPTKYFKDPPPVVDKRELLADLKVIEAENAAIMDAWRASGSNEPPVLKSIPGAQLKPSRQTVQIR